MHSGRQGSLSRIKQQNALCMWTVSLMLAFCCFANLLYLALVAFQIRCRWEFFGPLFAEVILNQLNYTRLSPARQSTNLCSLQPRFTQTTESPTTMFVLDIYRGPQSRISNVADDAMNKWIPDGDVKFCLRIFSFSSFRSSRPEINFLPTMPSRGLQAFRKL